MSILNGGGNNGDECLQLVDENEGSLNTAIIKDEISVFQRETEKNDAEFAIEMSIVIKPLESLHVKTKIQENVDLKMIAYRESIPPLQIVDEKLYLQDRESLRQRVRRVRTEIFP
jgi:hypothetical protein